MSPERLLPREPSPAVLLPPLDVLPFPLLELLPLELLPFSPEEALPFPVPVVPASWELPLPSEVPTAPADSVEELLSLVDSEEEPSVSLWVVVGAVVLSVGALVVVGMVVSVFPVSSVIFPFSLSETFPLPPHPVNAAVRKRRQNAKAIVFLMIVLHLFCIAGIVLHRLQKIILHVRKWRKFVAVFG